jgi:hypothetical protein
MQKELEDKTCLYRNKAKEAGNKLCWSRKSIGWFFLIKSQIYVCVSKCRRMF